ncbi:MAG: Stp1/IreP family PP2C-type Ser/Thr phosphatase [Clostridia bacterium]|nr:Stp1/IreP family PP2C-type Ser/Thr phosphatase [Clostridia bacterium]
MRVIAKTDCGKHRKINEDYVACQIVEDMVILLLADGMGGHNGGEVASKTAVDTVRCYLNEHLKKEMLPVQIFECIRTAISNANVKLLDMASKNKALQGMGTTLEVCVVNFKNAYIAHVGDSRVYKIGGKDKITQVTRDHSLVEEMVLAGTITREEARNHPQRNIITRAVGTRPYVEPDTYVTSFSENEVMVLCSDGLSNMVTDEEIYSIIKSADNPETAAEKLIESANYAGGIDNISVIVLDNCKDELEEA